MIAASMEAGFGGGLGLHFLGGKLLRALGPAFLGFHRSGQIRTRGLGHVSRHHTHLVCTAVGEKAWNQRPFRRGRRRRRLPVPFFHTSLFSFSAIHMVANAAVFFGVGRVDEKPLGKPMDSV